MTEQHELAEFKITHNQAYEQALLGSAIIGLVDPREIPDDSVWAAKHSVLLSHLRTAKDAGVPSEPNAVAGWLLEMHHADVCGGLGYVAELVGHAASSQDNAAWYAEQLAELARRRKLVECARRILQAHGEGADAEKMGFIASRAAAASAKPLTSLRSLSGMEDLALHEIELRVDRPSGLLTGFPDLDKELPGGLRAGACVSIAGPTGMGKTTFGLNIATHMAMEQGAPGIFFTMEMPGQEVYDKILSNVSSVWHDKILTGKLTDTDWTYIAKAAARMSDTPLWIHEGACTRTKIRQAIRAVRNQGTDVEFVAVDYVQLVLSEGGKRYGNRQEEVSAIMKDLRQLALEENVIMIVLVQCSRAAAGRADHHPLLSDLRESGEIENSSTHVFMLHSDSYYDKKAPNLGVAEIHVMKNRLGSAGGVIEVAAQLHMARYASLAAEKSEFHHQAA